MNFCSIARQTQKALLNTNQFRFCNNDRPQLNNFEIVMKNNREWAQRMTENDPNYFSSLVGVQKPKYLWIGCADSRVPANQILGLKPGQVFVHRNIANLVPPSDINVLSVLHYAIQYLKVTDIIVAGHYGCGGIKAAFDQNDFGPLQSWLSHLRQLRSKHRSSLIGDREQRQDSLVQFNVKQQVINVARIPVVQKAWKENSPLFIHGLIYNLNDGLLKDLGITLSKIQHVPSEFQIIK